MKIIDITPSRSWTSGCILNLYLDMKEGKDAKFSAKLTNRKLGEVLLVRKLIEKYGFEELYRAFVLLEENLVNWQEVPNSVKEVLIRRLYYRENEKSSIRSGRRK